MSVLSAWVAFGSQGDQQLPGRSLGNRDTLLNHSVVWKHQVLDSSQPLFKCAPRDWVKACIPETISGCCCSGCHRKLRAKELLVSCESAVTWEKIPTWGLWYPQLPGWLRKDRRSWTVDSCSSFHRIGFPWKLCQLLKSPPARPTKTHNFWTHSSLQGGLAGERQGPVAFTEP